MKRDTLSKQQVDATFNKFKAFFYEKVEKKGYKAFVGTHEVYGFLAEEVEEALHAMWHNEKEEFNQELFDIAMVCLFGYMSLKINKNR